MDATATLGVLAGAVVELVFAAALFGMAVRNQTAVVC